MICPTHPWRNFSDGIQRFGGVCGFFNLIFQIKSKYVLPNMPESDVQPEIKYKLYHSADDRHHASAMLEGKRKKL